MLKAWDRFWFEEKSSVDLGISRAIFFSLFLYFNRGREFFLWADVSLTDCWLPVGIFSVLEIPVLSRGALQGLEIIWVVALICSSFGIVTWLSTKLSFALSLYLLGIAQNFGKIHHSNSLAIVVMGILAFSSCGGTFSIDGLIQRWRGKEVGSSDSYNWPIRLIQVYMCLIYFAAGLQKYRFSGLEWAFSDNFKNLLISKEQPAGLWIAQFGLITQLLAAGALFLEFFAPLGLIHRYLGYFFMSGLFFMHQSGYLLFGSDLSFFVQMVCFVFWVPWSGIIGFFGGKLKGVRG